MSRARTFADLATASETGSLGQANLIINGDMAVAQRGTSSTSGGYHTVDRMSVGFTGTDEAPTITQADVASGTSPYTSGFRKSLKIQNGNQTSGAGAADEMSLLYSFEGQDLANSGWDVASASSNVTLSFWVKSSVSQQFQVNIRLYGPSDANQREFAFEYTPSADTWTKVTKTIPGHASNTLRGDTSTGMYIQFMQFYGTNYTASGRNFDTWEAKNNNQNLKDFTSTWYTTNDATWEITGLQLEVGEVATPFKHETFGDNLKRCQRYYCKSTTYGTAPGHGQDATTNCVSIDMASNLMRTDRFFFPTSMRADPTVTCHAQSGVSGSSTGQWAGYISTTWTHFTFSGGNVTTEGFCGAAGSTAGSQDGYAYWTHANWEATAEL
jgi:hypothetical protein